MPESPHDPLPTVSVRPGTPSTLADSPSGATHPGWPIIPGYEIASELGRGGMGVVYAAWQAGLRRTVALKVVLAGVHAGPSEHDRFRIEAEAVARLQHSNIVQVFDVGRHADHPYLALEYVEGGSLAQALDAGPLPPRWAAELAAALADATHYSHQHGIIHRDLTPTNVLLTAAGTPKITDFGLAKLIVDGSSAKTRTGAVLGTPPYMSPEQAAGSAIGPTTDVYGIGAILYEMLTGRPPFRADSVLETLRQVQEVEPVPPKRLNAAVPRDLETVCLKCLQKEPTRRYASAEALAADLLAWLDSRPVTARPIGIAERAMRWAKRNPAIAGLATVVAALLVVLGVGGTVAAVLLRGQRDAALTNLGRAEEAERATRRELGGSLLAQATAGMRSGLPGQRFASLELLERSARELADDPRRKPDLRERYLSALTLHDVLSTHRIEFGIAMNYGFDRRLTRACVVEDHSGETSIRELPGGAEIARLPRPRFSFWYTIPVFAPDGRHLLIHYAPHGDELGLEQLWRLDGPPRMIATWRGSIAPTFHPDSRRLLFATPENDLLVYDCEQAAEKRRVALGFRPQSIAIDRAGQRLALGREDKERITILDFATGRPLATLGPQPYRSGLTWSGDGRLLAATGGPTGRIYVWDVDRGEVTAELFGHTSTVVNLRFSPVGYTLGSTSWDGTSRLWDAAVGEQLLNMPGTSFFDFDADGRRIASWTGTTVELRELSSEAVCRTLHTTPVGNRSETRRDGLAMAAAYSPDGRWLAVGTYVDAVIFDAATGRRLARLDAGGCYTVHFDGDSLVTSGARGVFRWPIRGDTIGPPTLLWDFPTGREWQAAVPIAGRGMLGIIENANARVLLLATSHADPPTSRPPALDAEENSRMTTLAFSPDGRWAAAGGWKERGVYIWDVPQRKLVHVLPPADSGGDVSTVVAFSPDGQWLVWLASSPEKPGYYFRRVGTWEPGPFVPVQSSGFSAPAFSADGRLMAAGVGAHSLALLDPATGRELARLSTLDPIKPMPLVFSPDGSHLLVRSDRQTLLLWDLRAARAKLAALGVDWDRPAYGAEPPTRPSPEFHVVGRVHEPDVRRAAEAAAIQMYLLHVNPFDADALVHRGWLHAKAQRFPDASADFDLAGRLRPNHPTTHRWLAQMRQSLNDLDGMLVALDRHLKHHPADHESRLMRGRLAYQRGDVQVAIDDATIILTAREDDTARSLRAYALMRLGRPHDALADLDALVTALPDDADIRVRRANARQLTGDRTGAEADRVAATKIDPTDGDVYNSLAWLLLTAPPDYRNDARALELARKAVELDAENTNHRNTLGVALCRVGKYADAVPELERSLAASKGRADGFDLYFLAICHAKRGDMVKAKDCFDRAVLWHEAARLTPEHREELKAFQAEAQQALGSK
ncbi:MAG: protein kinase [Gemmataceae bacterium]